MGAAGGQPFLAGDNAILEHGVFSGTFFLAGRLISTFPGGSQNRAEGAMRAAGQHRPRPLQVDQ
ncbi:hypothetical protein HMPREF9946_03375 [Acetobacteraceae bacterium AT-5844]|nr:hypothetical protein HMPREF9946_03375 [Acetobacteraceae bacterium AT-5844]